MKYCIINLGCKVNSYECDFIREKLNEKGYTECPLDKMPEIVIINTCSVTNQSDAKSRHMIRLARRTTPNALIIALGCSAQNHKEELLEIGANIVLGNKDKSKITEYIDKYFIDHANVVKIYDLTNLEFESMFLKSENNKTRAFVKIQDGCDNFCSYCIIPYMRGCIRSKDIDLATLTDNNVKNRLNEYDLDKDGKITKDEIIAHDKELDERNKRSDEEESGLSTGAIIGIVVASVFVIGLVIGLIVYFSRKKKTTRSDTTGNNFDKCNDKASRNTDSFKKDGKVRL